MQEPLRTALARDRVAPGPLRRFNLPPARPPDHRLPGGKGNLISAGWTRSGTARCGWCRPGRSQSSTVLSPARTSPACGSSRRYLARPLSGGGRGDRTTRPLRRCHRVRRGCRLRPGPAPVYGPLGEASVCGRPGRPEHWRRRCSQARPRKCPSHLAFTGPPSATALRTPHLPRRTTELPSTAQRASASSPLFAGLVPTRRQLPQEPPWRPHRRSPRRVVVSREGRGAHAGQG